MKAIAMGLSAAVLFSMLPSANAWTGGGWQKVSGNAHRDVYVRPGCTKTVLRVHKINHPVTRMVGPNCPTLFGF